MERVIDLLLTSDTPSVEVGGLVTVQLTARAAVEQDVLMAGIQAILEWEPDVLELVGITNNTSPEYEWFLSGFNNDIGLDNLNDGVTAPPVGLPFNDGDAFYEAHAPFPPGPLPSAGPEGMLVTTLSFEALRASPLTRIALPYEMGDYTTAAVFAGQGSPGVDILRLTGDTYITVTPEPSTLVLTLLAATLVARRRTHALGVSRAARRARR